MPKRKQNLVRDFSYHERKPKVLWEQQEYLLSSLPNMEVQMARKLLERFGSVKMVVNVPHDELLEIEGVREKTAERLLKLFEEKYRKE